MRTLLFLLPLLLPVSHSAWAGGGISVKDPWVRQSPPGVSVTAAYMIIENSGPKADELVSASCRCSREASLHLTRMREGSDSMAMEEVGSIAVAPGGSVALSPGGYHVMLMGISGDMGKSVVIELEFRSGERVSVSAPVLGPSSASKKSGGHHHDGHH